MGYSCTVKAHDTLRKTLNTLNGSNINDYCYSNTYTVNGNTYFYERGKEQSDGSITGSIFKMLSETSCIKYGSLKIMPNGAVKTWSGMPKDKIVM